MPWPNAIDATDAPLRNGFLRASAPSAFRILRAAHATSLFFGRVTRHDFDAKAHADARGELFRNCFNEQGCNTQHAKRKTPAEHASAAPALHSTQCVRSRATPCCNAGNAGNAGNAVTRREGE